MHLYLHTTIDYSGSVRSVYWDKFSLSFSLWLKEKPFLLLALYTVIIKGLVNTTSLKTNQVFCCCCCCCCFLFFLLLSHFHFHSSIFTYSPFAICPKPQIPSFSIDDSVSRKRALGLQSPVTWMTLSPCLDLLPLFTLNHLNPFIPADQSATSTEHNTPLRIPELHISKRGIHPRKYIILSSK